MSTDVSPITALCIVADERKCPLGFTAITKTYDNVSDADLWRESAFSIWKRPVRFLCVSRQILRTGVQASAYVATDIKIVKEFDPIPYGFVGIDSTADSGEKALRKCFICVKEEPRDAVVDAIGEIIILNNKKKTPKDFTRAGEIDGLLICFRVVVVPPFFGLNLNSSCRESPSTPSIGLYPNIREHGISTADFSSIKPTTLYQTNQRIQVPQTTTSSRELDGLSFVLNPKYNKLLKNNQVVDISEFTSFDVFRLDTEEFFYSFELERTILANITR